MVVLVWPLVRDRTSVIPARSSTFLPVSPITSPLPFAAGIKVTLVDAERPLILNGTEVPGPVEDSQEPLPPLNANYVQFCCGNCFSNCL